MKFLLEMYGEHVGTKDACGRTPLHLAAQHGDLDTCLLLLRAGASPFDTGPDGASPLHYMCTWKPYWEDGDRSRERDDDDKSDQEKDLDMWLSKSTKRSSTQSSEIGDSGAGEEGSGSATVQRPDRMDGVVYLRILEAMEELSFPPQVLNLHIPLMSELTYSRKLMPGTAPIHICCNYGTPKVMSGFHWVIMIAIAY